MTDWLLVLMRSFLAPALPAAFVSGRRILFLGKLAYITCMHTRPSCVQAVELCLSFVLSPLLPYALPLD